MFSKEEFNRFYRYCLALTGDEGSAFDLLHDSLEKFLRKEADHKSPTAYFKRVIRNHFIDYYRKKIKYETVEVDEKILPIHDEKLDHLLASREEVKHILKNLNEAERELIYLWAVEEYTAKELSDLWGCSRGTILSRLHRLKIKIRDWHGKEKHTKERYEKDGKKTYPRALPGI